MVNAPIRWDTLWEDPDSQLEMTIKVYVFSSNYISYTNSDLIKCNLEGALFEDLSIGNACSSRLNFILNDAYEDSRVFTKYMKVAVECRLRKGSTLSGPAKQGTYYIDTIKVNDDRSVEVIAYDYFFIAENQDRYNESGIVYTVHSYLDESVSKSLNGAEVNRSYWNNETFLDNTVIQASSNKIGALKVNSGDIKSVREVIANAALLAGGNASIDKSNNLRLYHLDTGPTVTSEPLGFVVTAASLAKDERPQVITGIDLMVDNRPYESGSGWRTFGEMNEALTGLHDLSGLAASIAKNMHSSIDSTAPEAVSLRVSNIRANGVYISPLFELGDIASVDIGNGQYYNFMICEYNVNFAGGCWGSIGVTMTEQSVRYSIEDTFEGSWDHNWGQKKAATTIFGFNILSKRIFEVVPDKLVITGSNIAKSNMIEISEGLTPFSFTLQYRSTVDNTRKTVDVSSYPAIKYFPRESDDGSTMYISNLSFYSTTDLPDDAIGAEVISSVMIKDVTLGTGDICVKVLGSNN